MATATKVTKKTTTTRAAGATRSAAKVATPGALEKLVRGEIKIMSQAVSKMEQEFERFLDGQRAALQAHRPGKRPVHRTTTVKH